jgi:hypothetical protein
LFLFGCSCVYPFIFTDGFGEAFEAGAAQAALVACAEFVARRFAQIHFGAPAAGELRAALEARAARLAAGRLRLRARLD